MKATVQLMFSLSHEPYCLGYSVIPKLETRVVPRRGSGTCSRTIQSQLGLGSRDSVRFELQVALSLAKLPWASCLTSLESAGHKIGNSICSLRDLGLRMS